MQTGELNGYHYIYKPGQEPSSKILLLLHGTGGSELDLLGFAEAVDSSAGVISLRGNVSESGHARFFRRLAEGVFDEEDVARRSGDIAAFVRLAKEKHGFGDAEIIAVGFSNGANVASAVLALHPGTLDGAILMRAMVTVRSPGIRAADLTGAAGPKVLLLSGKEDSLVPKENAIELGSILSELSSRPIAHVWLDAGHGLTGEDLAQAKEWLTLNFK
ncbi:MAG TPA: alpha/beta hydrolase [Candidatus Paceibacterota bacterium]